MSLPRERAARRSPETAYADTNMFIALLVGPGHPLHEPALSIFRRVADGELVLIVTPIVVAELVYVGRSLLRWTRGVAADRLGELLSADGLAVSEAATVRRALRLYGERSRLDFADAYLAAAALEVGPAAVASLDAGFDTVDGVRRISG
ncbi:MAG: type II toxin-antitoxin system VapC family toxin [Chloroflexota bacterium]